jgi:hypothetical protein
MLRSRKRVWEQVAELFLWKKVGVAEFNTHYLAVLQRP